MMWFADIKWEVVFYMATVFSENPEKDLWRELLQFTYD